KKDKIPEITPPGPFYPTPKNSSSALICSLFRVCLVTVSFKKRSFFLPGAVMPEKRFFRYCAPSIRIFP
ncbi:MAG: hypothetical protein QQN46_09325, partial [Nitrosopumilus sp.]